jgi:hypothetical protein
VTGENSKVTLMVGIQQLQEINDMQKVITR